MACISGAADTFGADVMEARRPLGGGRAESVLFAAAAPEASGLLLEAKATSSG